MDIRRLTKLPEDIHDLASQARLEGHQHVDRLISDFTNGSNRFQRDGEALFGCFDVASIVAIGGLNQDPYTDSARVGRVRRVYVHPKHRRTGLGSELMRAIEHHAKLSFSKLQLFTTSENADVFYCSLGYDQVVSTTKISHAKTLTGDA